MTIAEQIDLVFGPNGIPTEKLVLLLGFVLSVIAVSAFVLIQALAVWPKMRLRAKMRETEVNLDVK